MSMDPEVREVIRKVRDEVLTGPERWMQGPAVVDEFGNNVAADSPTACRWCLFGALLTASGKRWNPDLDHRLDAALERAIGGVSYTGYVYWNEEPGRTWDDVRSLLDRALSEGGEALTQEKEGATS